MHVEAKTYVGHDGREPEQSHCRQRPGLHGNLLGEGAESTPNLGIAVINIGLHPDPKLLISVCLQTHIDRVFTACRVFSFPYKVD